MKSEILPSMKKEPLHIKQPRGFSLVEVILATSVFLLLASVLVGSYLYGLESTMLAGNRVRAVLLAEEGLEAVRNIRDDNFANISNGTHGLVISGNQWTLSGLSDTNGIFTRSLTIIDAGSARKSVSCTVSWQQNSSRSGSVTLTTLMTNWLSSTAPAGDCNPYAVSQGYSSGTCRQNSQQCRANGETYLLGGNAECVTNYPGNASKDTCCALP